MSGDTAAFLAGCAVTGVAAVLLLRGDFGGQSRALPVLQQQQPQAGIQTPTQPPTPAALPSPSIAPPLVQSNPNRDWQIDNELKQQQAVANELVNQLRQQQRENQDLKAQLQKQQSENEAFKDQLEKQQRDTERLVNQLQEQQRIIDRMSVQPARADNSSSDSSSTVQTIILVVGAILVVVLIGGTVLVVALIGLAALSRRRPPARTVHVVQPIPTPYPVAGPPLLPARASRPRPPKQVKQVDVEYYAE
jgi:hypothetical protein